MDNRRKWLGRIGTATCWLFGAALAYFLSAPILLFTVVGKGWVDPNGPAGPLIRGFFLPARDLSLKWGLYGEFIEWSAEVSGITIF